MRRPRRSGALKVKTRTFYTPANRMSIARRARLYLKKKNINKTNRQTNGENIAVRVQTAEAGETA